jgi:hypothetical protein
MQASKPHETTSHPLFANIPTLTKNNAQNLPVQSNSKMAKNPFLKGVAPNNPFLKEAIDKMEHEQRLFGESDDDTLYDSNRHNTQMRDIIAKRNHTLE